MLLSCSGMDVDRWVLQHDEVQDLDSDWSVLSRGAGIWVGFDKEMRSDVISALDVS